MLEQATIDNYLKGLRIRLQDAKAIQDKLQDPAGKLPKEEFHSLMNLRNEYTNGAGFILFQLFINGIEQIDLGEKL